MNPDDDQEIATETTGNENIEGYIDESIAAQDGETQATPQEDGAAPQTTPQQTSDPAKGGNGADPQPTGQQNRGATDLIDPTTGQVVARGGAERRMYERDAPARLMAVTRELAATQSQIKTHEDAASSARENNLSAEESVTAHKLLGAYKNDPVATIKYLLTQAQASGHNISDVGAGTDMAAIGQMITEKLAPITDQQKQQQEHHNHQAAAHQEAQQFLSRYPDAGVHEVQIAQLMQQRADLTPETAYFMLQAYYMKNGLDWTKPVTEQLGSDDGERQTGKTLPSGRGNSADTLTEFDTDRPASAEAEWDDIVSGALRSHNAA